MSKLRIGNLVKVNKTSYDNNGEVWRWQELSVILDNISADFLLVYSIIERKKYKVKKINCEVI
tara:strand:- start:246 stop:434 length:189 start_codon:yes stop_codon:yes gene_type:complete